jgi:hypothetical protein
VSENKHATGMTGLMLTGVHAYSAKNTIRMNIYDELIILRQIGIGFIGLLCDYSRKSSVISTRVVLRRGAMRAQYAHGCRDHVLMN